MKAQKKTPLGAPTPKGVRESGSSILIDAAKNSRNSEIVSQRQRVLIALRSGPKTTGELRELLGKQSQPAARILELRRQHRIITRMVTVTDPISGGEKRQARYSLIYWRSIGA